MSRNLIRWQNARAKTLQLTSDMERTLLEVAEHTGKAWDFFKDITTKLINCFKRESSVADTDHIGTSTVYA